MPSLAVILGAFASFAGFLFGYDTGYIAGCKTMPAFLEVYGKFDGTKWILPTSTDSLITSILSVGTFLGSLSGSTLGDRVGRRYGIVIYIFIFAVGVALQTPCKNIPGFAVGRVLAGLGVGGSSVLVPVYQAECSPKHIRGLIVSAYQFFLVLGLLVAACVVYATQSRGDASSYQIPIGVQFIWAAIIAGGTMVLPESPRWLIMSGKDDAGRASISRLLGHPVDSVPVSEQYAEIKANLEHERESGGGGRWRDVLRMGESKTFVRIASGMAVWAFQQLSGINFIIYYGTQFFQNSGVANPFVISIAVNAINTGMTIPGSLLADRVGRRFLTMYGALGMGISQFIVAALGVAYPTSNIVAQKVLVAFVCIYIGHFGATWGPIAWVITSETFPYDLRGKGMSLAVGTQWLSNFVLGFITPYLVNDGPGNAGMHTNVFWLWGGFCIMAFVFAYFFVYETTGLSLEQCDLLIRNSTPRTSNAYRKHILETNMHDAEMARYTGRQQSEKAASEQDDESV